MTTYNQPVYNGLAGPNKTSKEKVMSKKEYNGWTNYATWRVQLEFFSGHDDREWKSPEEMKHSVLWDIKCEIGRAHV